MQQIQTEAGNAVTFDSGMDQRIPLLEGMRGYLSWWVVVGHCLIEAGFDPRWLPGFAKVLVQPGYAVDVFVILSGFVITHLLVSRRPTYKMFIVGRFFRLYPLFLVSLIIAYVTFGVSSETYSRFQEIAPSYAYHPEVWKSHSKSLALHLCVSMSMLHGAIPNAMLPYAYNALVSPGWSISLEWQFYLIAPLLLFLLRRHLVSVCLILIATIAYRGHYDVGGWGSFLPNHFEFFALGIASNMLFRRLVGYPFRQLGIPNPSLILCALLFIIVEPLRSLLLHPYDFQVGEWLPIALWLMMMALALEVHSGVPSRFARFCAGAFLNRPIQFLGEISYSTYLLHYFGIYTAMALSEHLGVTQGKYRAAAVLLGVDIPITIALSVCGHKWIERPGIRFGRRVARRVAGGLHP
jgi:peptidoglycan/LPS O-acetylase OafA/YrhL